MRKIRIALAILLVLVFAAPAFAAPNYNSPELPRIIDNTNILNTQEKYDKVMQMITYISEKHGIDMVVLLEADSPYDTQNFNGLTYYDSEYDNYLGDYYESAGDFERVSNGMGGYTMLDGNATYGIGSERSGAIFGLNLAGGRRGDGNFMTVTLGKAYDMLPMAKLDQAHQFYEPLLRERKFYEALIVYLETTTEILEGRLHLRTMSFKNIAIAFLATGTIAAIITIGMAFSMSNISKGMYAGNYLVKDSFDLKARSDIYTHTTTSRTKIRTESSSKSGGGGGGTTSSGTSFGSSGGRF